MTTQRHIVSTGFGKFDVIEGRKLNGRSMTKPEAQALAARSPVAGEPSSNLESCGADMDTAARAFRAAYDRAMSIVNDFRGARPGAMTSAEMMRLGCERAMGNHLKGTLMRSPFGPPNDPQFNFQTVCKGWAKRIADATPAPVEAPTPTPRRRRKNQHEHDPKGVELGR